MGTGPSGASYPAAKDRAAPVLADFLHQQFGVETLANFGRFLNRDEEATSEANAPYAVETLKDDETIARLAPGIKRFKLPDEFNFLRIYRDVAASGKKTDAERALLALASIYENRRQYPQAAEKWRECIRRFGTGNRGERQARLDQIIGNWGCFEPTTTLPATAGQKIGFRFRNGTRLELEAHAIRVEKLLEDVKTYLKSSHTSFDWNEINLANIGYRLVVENQSQYLGDRVAQWTLTLQPRPKHVDHRIEVSLPLQRAGAYLITAKMAGGNTSRIVLWIADTALVRKSSSRGAIYFLADAVTGQPISGANVEFFGYKRLDAPAKRIRVGTLDFAETSDADGQVVPDPEDMQTGYDWIAIARGAGGRLAFLGFERIGGPRHRPRRFTIGTRCLRSPIGPSTVPARR